MWFLIAAALAPAENSTGYTSLVALAVLLETLGLLTLAALADLVRLNPQTEPHLVLRHVLPLLLLLEPMRVPRQRLDNGLLVLLLVVVGIPAGLAVAVRRAELLLLEALAVEFETATALATAAQLARHLLLLVDHRQNDVMRTFGIAALGEGGRGVPHRVRHREALLELLLEGFAEGLRVHRVLRLDPVPLPLRVLARTVVLDGGRDEAVVGTRGVEDLPEIGPPQQVFGRTIVNGLFGLLDLHGVVQRPHQELLEDVAAGDGRLLLHKAGTILVYFDILFIHPGQLQTDTNHPPPPPPTRIPARVIQIWGGTEGKGMRGNSSCL